MTKKQAEIVAKLRKRVETCRRVGTAPVEVELTDMEVVLGMAEKYLVLMEAAGRMVKHDPQA